MKHALHPTPESQRIDSIDTLRGFALLGILLINIVGMGLPDPAYFDPSWRGSVAGWNLKVFVLNSLFFEGAMRGLFSLLFGAGIIMFFKHKEGRHHQYAVEVWFRRLLWLIPLGMFQAYVLLWPGDILFSYGMIGLMLYPFRRLKAIHLLFFSLMLLVVAIALNVNDVQRAKKEQQRCFEAVVVINKGEALDYDLMVPYYAWIERYAVMKPTADILDARVDNYHQGYAKAFKENKPYAQFFESEYHYRHKKMACYKASHFLYAMLDSILILRRASIV